MPATPGYRPSLFAKADKRKATGFGKAPIEPAGHPMLDYILGLQKATADPRLTSEEMSANKYVIMADYLKENPSKYQASDAITGQMLSNLADQLGGLWKNKAAIPGAIAEGIEQMLVQPYDVAEEMVGDVKGAVANPGRAALENPLGAILALSGGVGKVGRGVLGRKAARQVAEKVAAETAATEATADLAAMVEAAAAQKTFMDEAFGMVGNQPGRLGRPTITPKQLGVGDPTGPSHPPIVTPRPQVDPGIDEMMSDAARRRPAREYVESRLMADVDDMMSGPDEVVADVDKILPEPSMTSKIDELTDLTEGIPEDLLEDARQMGLLPGLEGKAAKRKVKPRPDDTEMGAYDPKMGTINKDVSTGPDPRSFQIEKVQVSPDKAKSMYEKLMKDFGSGEAQIGGTRVELVKRGKGFGIEVTQHNVTHSVPGEISKGGNIQAKAAKRVMEILGLN